jgi:hypothetical protein
MEIKCNNCNWTGTGDDLEILKDDFGKFVGCPECKTDKYLVDLDDLSIRIIDQADYPDDKGLFYQDKYDVVCLHHDKVGQLGWFKVWWDYEMDKRRYITLNDTIIYLDTIDEL